MARARNIKPGFFKNEILGVADPLYSILFEGLWVLADRSGRLEDRPLRIKGEIFPYRDGIDMEAMLGWLQSEGFIRRYIVAGKRYILVLEFVKHQNPHKNEAESILPPPDEIGTEPELIGTTRADSLSSDSLIPDSPITDTGFSDSPITDLSDHPPAEDGSPAKRPRAAKQPKEPAPTTAIWMAYATAYQQKYKTPPVRNAMVNGQLAQLLTRLGAEDAQAVAEFYLGHKNRYYVEKMHPVGLLLSDAEKLRTEWFTGRQVTAQQAIQADRTQTNFAAFAPLLAEAERS
jgi:hypothetical protein